LSVESIESRLVSEPGLDSVQTKLEPPKQPKQKTEDLPSKPKVVVSNVHKSEVKGEVVQVIYRIPTTEKSS